FVAEPGEEFADAEAARCERLRMRLDVLVERVSGGARRLWLGRKRGIGRWHAVAGGRGRRRCRGGRFGGRVDLRRDLAAASLDRGLEPVGARPLRAMANHWRLVKAIVGSDPLAVGIVEREVDIADSLPADADDGIAAAGL